MIKTYAMCYYVMSLHLAMHLNKLNADYTSSVNAEGLFCSFEFN